MSSNNHFLNISTTPWEWKVQALLTLGLNPPHTRLRRRRRKKDLTVEIHENNREVWP